MPFRQGIRYFGYIGFMLRRYCVKRAAGIRQSA